MKSRAVIFISILVSLGLTLDGVFPTPVLAQRQSLAAARGSTLEERIRRVEYGLLPAVVIKGDQTAKMKIADRMQFYKTPAVSVAVINDGRIEWARGYGVLETGGTGPVTTDTIFQAASISKPVAAFGVLSLVEKGKLNLDEDVNIKLTSWKVPENEFTKEQKVTLRGMLSHSNSLTVHGFGGYASDTPIPTLVQILDGTAPANSKPIRVDGVPHKAWRYAGGGYVLTQKLFEDVTGQEFPSFMTRTVFRKLEMKRSTYEQPLPKEFWCTAAVGHRSNGEKVKGNWHAYPEMMAAGLWTTPSDLARFAIEIQRSKAGRSNKVLSVKTINDMLTPQPGGWALGPELQGEKDASRFAHGGANEGYRCLMVAYTSAGKGAVVMANSDSGGALVAEIMRSIAAEYGWVDYLQPEKVVASVDPGVLEKYVGQYQLNPNVIISVTAENGKLVFQPTGQSKNELLAESETEFFMKTADVQIRFVKDTLGNVTGLVLRQGRRETPVQKIK